MSAKLAAFYMIMKKKWQSKSALYTYCNEIIGGRDSHEDNGGKWDIFFTIFNMKNKFSSQRHFYGEKTTDNMKKKNLLPSKDNGKMAVNE